MDFYILNILTFILFRVNNAVFSWLMVEFSGVFYIHVKKRYV